MKKIDIKEINNLDECYFHFTNKKNLESINISGLLPRIGENSNNIEATPKVFFSKGGYAMLKTIDVWVRYYIYIIAWRKYYSDGTMSFSDYRKSYADKTLLLTDEILNDIYDSLYKYLNDQVYLKLDLIEGVDYSSLDIDEAKSNYNPAINRMYGKYSNVDSPTMEDWNMHTNSGLGIDTQKISLIHNDETYNAIDIIEEVCTKYDTNELDDLNEFLIYVRENYYQKAVKR